MAAYSAAHMALVGFPAVVRYGPGFYLVGDFWACQKATNGHTLACWVPDECPSEGTCYLSRLGSKMGEEKENKHSSGELRCSLWFWWDVGLHCPVHTRPIAAAQPQAGALAFMEEGPQPTSTLRMLKYKTFKGMISVLC